MARGSRAIAVWIALGLAFSTTAAVAQEALSEAPPTAETARAIYLEARFREAADAFEAVLGRDDLDVRAAADAHVHLAALRHVLEEPERARAHAEAAVALVPDVALPEGAAAEVGAMIEQARRRFHDAPARLSLSAERADEGVAQRRVRARLAPAPGALGLELSLGCGAAGIAPAEARGAPPEVEVVVPADRAARCEAVAATRGGARLFVVRRELGPAAALTTADGDDSGASPWPWVGVVAGVAVAAGIAIAIVLSSSDGNPVISSTDIDAGGW
jgi:hypothetical protein